jgi:DNA replication protein DnaC
MELLKKEEKEQLLEKIYKVARIPKIFFIASLKSPSRKLDSYYKRAEKVVDETALSGDVQPVNGIWPQRGIFMVGAKRSGKSFLAVAILQELMLKHRCYGLFLNVSDLFHQLKKSMNRSDCESGAYSGRKLIEKAIEVEFLILDDFACVPPNSWVLETFYNILEQRWSNLRFTIITCDVRIADYQNSLPQSLQVAFERISGRIENFCTMPWILPAWR